MPPGQADDALQRARDVVNSASCVVAFSGAGLSAESGVPTFRDAQTGGMWDRYDPMTLASPGGFAQDPRLVIDWYAYRRKLISDARPNPAHTALAQRADVFNVTQNVDDLLHRAGASNIVQLHGRIDIDRCNARCGHEEHVDMTDPPGLRPCPGCGSRLRPGVVWFGESLPADAWTQAEQRCAECDCLLVVGTSAVVYPAAGLIGLAKSAGARIVLVNTRRSEASGMADVEVIGKAGAVLPALLSA